jgi:uncharacterized membrane protein
MRSLKNTLWFVAEVVGIFVLVQAVRYAIGNWDALVTGLALLAMAVVLFVVAFLVARFKDKQDRRRPSDKEYSGVVS